MVGGTTVTYSPPFVGETMGVPGFPGGVVDPEAVVDVALGSLITTCAESVKSEPTTRAVIVAVPVVAPALSVTE